MMLGAAIGIICKTPHPGGSKTRLVPLLGARGAAELAAAFLRDTAAAIEAVPAAAGRRGYGVYAPQGSEAELRPLLPEHFGFLCRRDATLGGVLLSATEHLLAQRHDCVLLVNADSPTMPPLLLAVALAALRAPGDRAVIGPATDGGYYLIGLKHPHARLFADIPWSTPGVMDATLARARELGLVVALLPPWYDVDDAQSLAVLVDDIDGRSLPFDASGLTGGPAPATRALLGRLRLQHLRQRPQVPRASPLPNPLPVREDERGEGGPPRALRRESQDLLTNGTRVPSPRRALQRERGEG
jgi:rSAM/selenodomain-associated transferase 1